MKCSLISPDGHDDFQDLEQIFIVAPSGEWELLEGHIPIIVTLKDGQSLSLVTKSGGKVLVTVSAGAFFRFAKDHAEVLAPWYSVFSEGKQKDSRALVVVPEG